MKTGLLKVTLYIPYSHSLKEKRSVLNAIKDRLKNRFNISVAEVGDNDKWQKSELGIALVANKGKYIAAQLNKASESLRGMPGFNLVSSEMDIIDC